MKNKYKNYELIKKAVTDEADICWNFIDILSVMVVFFYMKENAGCQLKRVAFFHLAVFPF